MLARGSFPKAGLLLGFGGGFSNIWRVPKSLAGNCEARQAGSLGDEARDVGSSPGSSIPEWPWASLWFYFLALSFSISKIKGLNKMLSKGFPSSKILIFYKWDSGLFKTFFFLFGVSFYLWQQIRNSFRIKEHGMEIIWLLRLKRSTRFRNVLQACAVCMET